MQVEDISDLFQLSRTLIPFEIDIDKSFEIYKEIQKDDNYYLLVAKEDNVIVGTALGICCKSLTVPFLVIEDVIVKEELRRKGIGRKLMDALDEFAKRRHCAYAILVSSGFRKEAHKFYENVGFKDSVQGFGKFY